MVQNTSEVFKRPTTVFQQKINDIMVDDPTKDMILDIFELQMFKNAEKDSKALVYIELYNLLGVEKFMEVMDILSGKTIKFPHKDDFKETVQVALCYYYKQFRHMNWEQIKEKLGDKDLQSVKFGIKVQQLQRFIGYISDKVRTRYTKDENNE